MIRIKIDRDKCIGCLTCVTACSVSHGDGDSRNRVTVDSKSKMAPIFCRNCSQPECVYTCMTGAMSKNYDTNFVEYNKDRCASCYMCIMACPYGVLKSDDNTKKTILKCNMCTHLTEDGKGDPYCVAKCPMSAITIEEV